MPLLLPPLLLCQIHTPCQGLCILMALKNSINSSCQVCPLSHSAQTPPATPLTAPGYSPSSIPLLSSAVQASFSSLVCAHPAVFLRHGKAILLRIRHLGCLQLFTSTHHQPAVLERMEDFFFLIKVLLVVLLQYKTLTSRSLPSQYWVGDTRWKREARTGLKSSHK